MARTIFQKPNLILPHLCLDALNNSFKIKSKQFILTLSVIYVSTILI